MGRGNRDRNLAQVKAGRKYAVDNENGIRLKFSNNVGILENNAIREYLIELNGRKFTNHFLMAFASQTRDILQKFQANGNEVNEAPEAMPVVLNLGDIGSALLAYVAIDTGSKDCYDSDKQSVASNTSSFFEVNAVVAPGKDKDNVYRNIADDWVDAAEDYETKQDGDFTVVSP